MPDICRVMEHLLSYPQLAYINNPSLAQFSAIDILRIRVIIVVSALFSRVSAPHLYLKRDVHSECSFKHWEDPEFETQIPSHKSWIIRIKLKYIIKAHRLDSGHACLSYFLLKIAYVLGCQFFPLFSNNPNSSGKNNTKGPRHTILKHLEKTDIHSLRALSEDGSHHISFSSSTFYSLFIRTFCQLFTFTSSYCILPLEKQTTY